MGRTKKVGITGRYGVRYGRSIKQRALEVERESKKPHTCPRCLKAGKLGRVTAGVWECSKCGLKFAGKAYKPM
ncbi:MAG: 50S ribosomal protein L37ae [Candidatus Aenigmarchaeota archaeon]|nr:50S ribosomal protein L37ae [Candidatus Aenigmarchaeota archaeon]